MLVSKREEYVEREAGFLKEIKSLKAQIAELNRSMQRKDESNKKLRKEVQKKSAEQDATQNESLKLSTEYEQLLSKKEGTIERMMRGFDEERAELKKAKFAAEEKKRSAVRAMKKEKQLRQEAELIVEEERLKAEKANQLYSKAKKDQVVAATKMKEAVDALAAQQTAFTEAVESKDTMEKQWGEMEEKHEIQVDALRKEIEQLRDNTDKDRLQEELVRLKSDLEEKTALAEQMERDAKASEHLLQENEVLVSSLTQEVKKLTNQLNAQESVTSHQAEEAKQSVLAEKEELSKRLETIQSALASRNISVEFLLGTSSLGSNSPKKSKRPEQAISQSPPVQAKPKTKITYSPKVKTKNSEEKHIVKRKASQSKIVVKPVARKTPSKKKEEVPVRKAKQQTSAEKAQVKVTTLPKVKLKLRNTDQTQTKDSAKPPRETVPAMTLPKATKKKAIPKTTPPTSTDERHEIESVRKSSQPTAGASSSSQVRVNVRQGSTKVSSRTKRSRRTSERDRSRHSGNQAESPGSRRNAPTVQQTAQRKPRKPKPVVRQENLSKLDLGMNAADIAPESSPRSETNSEGGIHSLLFARPDSEVQPIQACAS